MGQKAIDRVTDCEVLDERLGPLKGDAAKVAVLGVNTVEVNSGCSIRVKGDVGYIYGKIQPGAQTVSIERPSARAQQIKEEIDSVFASLSPQEQTAFKNYVAGL